jgi:hypothetical protein
MYTLPTLTDNRTVNIIRILKSGELVLTLDEYRQVADRFAWEDRTQILKKLFSLKEKTDDNGKSVIVIYEEGKQITEFLNVEEYFTPPAVSVG